MAVRVTPDAERQIRGGHPWLFDSSITSSSHHGDPGDLAVVFDRRRAFVAIGLFDPTSPLRVRILHQGRPTPIDTAWWRSRLTTALSLRTPLVESAGTTGLRLVNGENDGFPGLVVDRYDNVLVLALYTTAWIPHLATVIPLLVELVGPRSIVVRLSRLVRAQECHGLTDGMTIHGDVVAEPIRFLENGLRFEADVVRGQKTGHFLDQRDNRAIVRSLAAGVTVLDVFSCTGGFSVHAAAGGATAVRAVDVSPHALAAVAKNFELNSDLPAVAALQPDTVQGDAFEVMATLADRGDRYGMVIIDPPSFAKRQSDVADALRAYRRLTGAALELVSPGGVLVQASCSSRVTTDQFFDAVHAGSIDARVELYDVETTGHALDHPISFPEGAYLDAVIARVRPVPGPAPQRVRRSR